MRKSISRFDPTPTLSPEECERHYTSVHIPMAQNFLRAMPGVLSYHAGRAVAQADVAGGFAQRPLAWRFVVLRFSPESKLAFTPEQRRTVTQDHVNCLYRLRSCDVEERIRFDRRDGQTSSAKFLIEVERNPDVTHADAERSMDRLVERVQRVMENAFGSRLLLANRVLSEAVTESVDVEGQRIVGNSTDTTRLGYLECYFDHRRWGIEALAPLVPEGALRDPAFAWANLLEIEEHTALDLR